MNPVGKCGYDLGNEDFWLAQDMMYSFEGEYDMKLDDAIRRMEEHEPEAGKKHAGCLGMFGGTLSEIFSNIRLHVRKCEQCRKAYRDYMERQKRDYMFVSNVFRKAEIETESDVTDSLDQDFLGLYVH